MRDQRGFTLIEMMVAMMISMIVLGAGVLIFTAFINDNRYDGFRADAQNDAQVMVDRLSRDVRSAASPSSGSAGLLQQAAPYDLVFQTVSTGQATGNPGNQMWARYCLDANLTLWRQTSVASTTSSMPDTSACPSTSSAWVGSSSTPCCAELNDVTNEIGGDTTRPLFTYGPPGAANPNQLTQVQVNLYVDRNPGHPPGPTMLTSGIYLRNELSSPVGSFSPTVVGHDVQLNASASSDPNGQALTYQWYSAKDCPSGNAIAGATTQQYDAGSNWPSGTQWFSLMVTNSGGLTNCANQQVTIQ
jgi:prepilin-type N-terminal cleavage/methylation domain-containing protein